MNLYWRLVFRNTSAQIALGYFLFFTFLYLRFPLNQTLPGNTDTWLVISLSNQYWIAFQRLFDDSIGYAMFPVVLPFFYGEASPICASLFLIFKLLFFGSDLWAYYGYLVTILTLTAFSLYRLCSLLFPTPPQINIGAVFAGFAFTCSGMIFSHIDDSIIFFYFIPFTAAYYLIVFLREGNSKYALTAMVLGGMQVYSSLYVFIYQSLFLGLIVIFFGKASLLKKTMDLAKPSLIYLILSLPFFLFYLYGLFEINIIDPFSLLYTAQMGSLMPFDFFASVNENNVWGSFWTWLPDNWGFMRHRNFIGVTLIAFGVYGLLHTNRKISLFLFTLIVTGVVFGMGPYVMLSSSPDNSIPAPLNWFYTDFPILSFIRLPHRAYFLVLLAMSISSAFAVNTLLQYMSQEYILRKMRLSLISQTILLSVLIFSIYAFENIPINIRQYSVANTINISDEYKKVAKQIRKINPNAVVLDLPSSLTMDFVGNKKDWQGANPMLVEYKKKAQSKLTLKEVSTFNQSGLPLYHYNREIVYMYWQSIHHLSTVNGLNGYFSLPRIVYHYWTVKLPQEEAIAKLKSFGVDYFILHKNMFMEKECFYPIAKSNKCSVSGEFLLTEEQLDNSNLLDKTFSGKQISVYRIISGNST